MRVCVSTGAHGYKMPLELELHGFVSYPVSIAINHYGVNTWDDFITFVNLKTKDQEIFWFVPDFIAVGGADRV